VYLIIRSVAGNITLLIHAVGQSFILQLFYLNTKLIGCTLKFLNFTWWYASKKIERSPVINNPSAGKVSAYGTNSHCSTGDRNTFHVSEELHFHSQYAFVF
jgi:hypothetical protein